MNRLSRDKRKIILGLIVEGTILRAIERQFDVSLVTIEKLLMDAGAACRKYHTESDWVLEGIRNFQCDEIHGYVYAKRKNADSANPLDHAGDVWLWTALDHESRLIAAYHCDPRRDANAATAIFRDLKTRVTATPHIYTDMLDAYGIACRDVFGHSHRLHQGKADGTTSHVERHNLSIRTHNRRYTRRTIAFSKSLEHHRAMLDLWMLHYNHCRIHLTLKVSPAMAAGIDNTLRDLDWIVDLIEANTPAPKKPGPKPGSKNRKRPEAG